MNSDQVSDTGDGQINSPQTTPLTWFRRVSQGSMLFIIGEFSFYGIFRCPFAKPYVSCANCPVIQCPGRWMVYPFWILLGLTTILFGRSFCGWACPGGFISGVLSTLTPVGKKISAAMDQKLHLVKYGVLPTALFIWLFMSNPRWAIPIRTGEFLESVRLTVQHADNLWLIRTCIVVMFIVIGGLLGNLWCRYLCPTGGLLEMMKKPGLFLFRKTGGCNSCGLCRKVCEYGTEPEGHNCTNCGDCINSCPSDAIYFGRKHE